MQAYHYYNKYNIVLFSHVIIDNNNNKIINNKHNIILKLFDFVQRFVYGVLDCARDVCGDHVSIVVDAWFCC
jgi:hypothetical protein